MISLFSSFDISIFFYSTLFFTLSLFLWLPIKSFIRLSFLSFNFENSLNLPISIFRSTSSGIPEFISTHLCSVFLLIILLNLFSVGPFIFPYSSQISIVMIFSLFTWISSVSFFSFNNYNSFSSHLVPEGSPLGLVPILVVIEFISNLIRPLTLTVRLVANIVAGHVLIELFTDLAWNSLLLFSFYPLLSIVEILVALIQAYVFMIISLLYIAEVN